MAGKKYNNEDIQRILKSAAERQQRDHARQDSDTGLSLDELERIAAEAGIDPKYIREAARETSPTSTIRKESKLVGAVTDFKLSRSIPVHLESADLAAELIPVMRDTMGKNGAFEQLGNTLSWNEAAAGPSASYTKVTVSSNEDESNVTAEFTNNVKVSAYLFHFIPYFFGIVTLIALTAGKGDPAAIFFGLIFLVGMIASRFGLSAWSRNLADKLHHVVDDLEDKLLEIGTPAVTEEVASNEAAVEAQTAGSSEPLIDLDEASNSEVESRSGTRARDRS